MDGLDEVRDEISHEFLAECAENLAQLDLDLAALARDPGSMELVDSIFRTLHTIKGTSGLLTFSRLEETTHAGEALLARLRDGELPVSPAVVTVLAELAAAVRVLLARIAAAGTDAGPDIGRVLAAIRAATAGVVDPGLPARPEDDDDPDRPRLFGEPSVRVPVELLDNLLRQVGELSAARDQLAMLAERPGHTELPWAVRRLDRIAADLHGSVLRARLQPLEQVWCRFPRLVRTLGDQCGKQVRLHTDGSETRLDRSVLEAIRDPLTHLVRNAIDHGIESSARRLAAGKPAHGTLRLRARQSAGQVLVEVADDGAGLDLQALGSGALARGLVTSEQLAAMTANELSRLVFQPGLSTAPAITTVSGRGVGMDVVRTNVEGIGGSVEIESVPGRGTTCRLRVPRLPARSA